MRTIEERNKLVLDNMALVTYVVKKIYLGYDEYEDLFQEGCVGLIMAAERYDESYGYTFSTYALSYISGYLKKYKNDKSMDYHGVKIPRAIYGSQSSLLDFISFQTPLKNDEDECECSNFLEFEIDKGTLDEYTIIENEYLYEVLDGYIDKKLGKEYSVLYRAIVGYIKKNGEMPKQRIFADYLGVSQAYVSRMIKKINNIAREVV